MKNSFLQKLVKKFENFQGQDAIISTHASMEPTQSSGNTSAKRELRRLPDLPGPKPTGSTNHRRQLPVLPPRTKSIARRQTVFSKQFSAAHLALAITSLDINQVARILQQQPELIDQVPTDKRIKFHTAPLQQAIFCALEQLGCGQLSQAQETFKMIDLLLAHGANINQADNQGTLPLDFAIDNIAYLPLAEHLLLNGADPNKLLSPIHRALAINSPRLVKLLIQAGARTDIQDIYSHRTPLQQAVEQNKPRAFDLLRFYAPRTSKDVQYVQSKLFAHRFNLGGKLQFEGETIDLEGFDSAWSVNALTKSFAEFTEVTMGIPHFQQYQPALQQTLTVLKSNNHQRYDQNPYELAKKIFQQYRHQPHSAQVLNVVWSSDRNRSSHHSVQMILRGNLLYICNRGEGSQSHSGTNIYKIQHPENLTVDLIRQIITKGVSKNFIQEALPKRLGLALAHYLPGEEQIVGNCSMASAKELIKALMFDSLIQQKMQPHQAEKLVTGLYLFFEDMDALRALEDQLTYHRTLTPGSGEFEVSATLLRRLLMQLDITKEDDIHMCQSIVNALIFEPQRLIQYKERTTLQYIAIANNLLENSFINDILFKDSHLSTFLDKTNLAQMSQDLLNDKHYLSGQNNEIHLLKSYPTILALNLHKAVKADDPKAVFNLLALNPNISFDPFTLVQLAAGYNSTKVLSKLIEQGHDINASAAAGELMSLCPLSIALLKKSQKAAEMLIKAGAKVRRSNSNTPTQSPAYIAILTNNTTCLKAMLRRDRGLAPDIEKLLKYADSLSRKTISKMLMQYSEKVLKRVIGQPELPVFQLPPPPTAIVHQWRLTAKMEIATQHMHQRMEVHSEGYTINVR